MSSLWAIYSEAGSKKFTLKCLFNPSRGVTLKHSSVTVLLYRGRCDPRIQACVLAQPRQHQLLFMIVAFCVPSTKGLNGHAPPHATTLYNLILATRILDSSVGDPDPQDPHVFGPPGSGSISQRYGSGSRSGSFPFLIDVVRMPAKFNFNTKF